MYKVSYRDPSVFRSRSTPLRAVVASFVPLQKKKKREADWSDYVNDIRGDIKILDKSVTNRREERQDLFPLPPRLGCCTVLYLYGMRNCIGPGRHVNDKLRSR